MKTFTRFSLMVGFLLSLAGLLSGCGGSSNDPVSSGAISGTGYKIRLGSSAEVISPGGTVVLTAMVFDPNDNPVPDGSLVLFSSAEVGTFEGATDGKVETTGGVATVVFRSSETTNADKPQPSKANRLFASYAGAVVFVEIIMVSPTF